MKRLEKSFFNRDVLEVAPDLVGKYIVSKLGDNQVRVRITETEAYCGEQDTACHAHKGRTKRTEVLYGESGMIYVYLCYGVHWLMNVITGDEGDPQGVLIRAGEGFSGPAKLTKHLGIAGEINLQRIYDNPMIWIEDDECDCSFHTDKRVGINCATDEYINKQWRYILKC